MIEEKRRRMAMSLIRCVHECDAGMRQGIKYYRSALSAGNNAEADALLKRAARLPYRVNARLQNMITRYSEVAVNNSLALVSTFTVADLNAELSPLMAYSDQLKANFQSGATLEDIALDIEANSGQIDTDEVAPWPDTYVDDM